MSEGTTFLARFLDGQRAKGANLGPLFTTLERLADVQHEEAPQPPPASWPLGHPAPQPAPAPLHTPYEGGAIRTVQQLAAERTTSRVQFEQTPPAPVLELNPVQSLTACLDEAEQPRTARRIYRLLFELALDSVRARGLPHRPDVGVYHLPVELIASHLEIDRTTVWRNVRPLLDAGVLAARDHYGTLRGQNVVTGKLWAVSLCPERVLSGQAPHVRVTKGDLAHPWRDIEADARRGQTAYALTRTEARQAADKAQREERAEEQAQARARADQRRAERQAARARGEQVPTGRAAATANAAKTRAEKPRPTRPKESVQQSLEGLKTVGKAELKKWVLAAFSDSSDDVTLTVAGGPADGLDAAFTLPTLAHLSRSRRSEMVEKTARTLAASFGDGDNLRFWCWLVWQTLRAYDQGQDWTEDVAHIIARVLHDVKHEARQGVKVDAPAALVVNALRNCGLLDALRAISPTRVGRRPKAA